MVPCQNENKFCRHVLLPLCYETSYTTSKFNHRIKNFANIDYVAFKINRYYHDVCDVRDKKARDLAAYRLRRKITEESLRARNFCELVFTYALQ